MRKLTSEEEAALFFLDRDGACVPGFGADPGRILVRSVLDSLVRKKRVTVEMTDDGPRYSIIPGVV